jgi:uncharacterized membrane protein
MGTIPSLGFVTINPTISFTLLHIPVLIGAYLFGTKGGLYYGFLFGFLSFWQANANPTGILDPFFQNPIISVLPRLLFGGLAGFGFSIVRFLQKKQWLKDTLLSIFAGFFTLLHTLLVLGIMGLIRGSDVLSSLASVGFTDTYWAFILLVLTLNGVWEIILGMVIVPAIAVASSKISSVRRIMSKREV